MLFAYSQSISVFTVILSEAKDLIYIRICSGRQILRLWLRMTNARVIDTFEYANRILFCHCGKLQYNDTFIIKGETTMGNKKASTRNKKKEDGKFRSKHVKHDPQAESARAVFGVRDQNADDPH